MLVFCSLSGSPGVTTAAYGTASVMAAEQDRHTLLAECDECGGDLSVRLSMPATPGLATLAAAARRGLGVEDLWDHVQESPTRVGLLLGLASAEQSGALGFLWEELARVLAAVNEAGVVVDAGRLMPGMVTLGPLLRESAAVIVVARPDAVSLVQAARRLPTLRSLNPSVHLVLSGSGPYAARDAEESTGIEVVGTIDAGRRGGDRAVAGLAKLALDRGWLDTSAGTRIRKPVETADATGEYRLSSTDDQTAARRPVTSDGETRESPALRAVSLRELRERAGGRSGSERYAQTGTGPR